MKSKKSLSNFCQSKYSVHKLRENKRNSVNKIEAKMCIERMFTWKWRGKIMKKGNFSWSTPLRNRSYEFCQLSFISARIFFKERVAQDCIRLKYAVYLPCQRPGTVHTYKNFVICYFVSLFSAQGRIVTELLQHLHACKVQCIWRVGENPI